MTGTTTQQPTNVRHWAARIITEVAAPAVCALAALLVIVIRNANTTTGAAWGVFAATFVAVIPMGYIAHSVKKGKLSDHHIADRTQRRTPLLIAAGSVTLAVIVLVVGHAPRELTAVVIAMLGGLLTVIAVTHWWKVSIHAAVAGGLVAVLVALFGPWAMFAVLLVAAIGWSRTVLGAHTWPQIIAGSILGALMTVALFIPLR
ncbi:phosphatase PAP2 family protein [Nakamurella endophytica]|uniref:Phosphatase PAP2 family protein n=1 Tax=Nakamurella endophytica TaxID=1748367 RepID=A0A917TAW3_9ACTN|nr:phosphatase PAP2 family protein [Nakamurella endophytica]GGM16027.1 hypothetical protein GCM10011594_40040 [Nakamurella endophytica]